MSKIHTPWPLEIPDDSPFSMANIPFGIFSTKSNTERRAGAAIGTLVIDLSVLETHGFFADCLLTKFNNVFNQSTLNNFASLPLENRSAIRKRIINLLDDRTSAIFNNLAINSEAILRMSDATLHLPMQIGGFTDFMCSRTHIDNSTQIAGRSANPQTFAQPMAYNGRASSIVVSGTPIHRPCGMIPAPGGQGLVFGPCEKMDFELELGFFVSKPIPFGHRIKTADEAREHIFGFILLNDWSARDIQLAEMFPLGPFNGKGSGTSISPWVVTLDALEAARTCTLDVGAATAMANLPQHLRHMTDDYTWDILVESSLKRVGIDKTFKIGRSSLRDSYWSPGQMLSYHASSGCGFRTGDLLGTGTLSSPGHSVETPSLACLLELTEGGTKPFVFGENSLTWIEDGDEVVFEGWAMTRDGHRIGFGELRGTLLPSLP
ncbi:putative 2-hydroxyhepta-2,4-diene-1,7-dioate isomerase [Talaromyces proteolyticus]|uniref:Fumarylacetoacetase n=1 Tax=Talaromyces proteolyticus TaxID=1131652 RepID=A0AAD4KFJ7_9EURO|nr:putative 2-hydroxyhepta-2,4-diene-1,7-dioate isomerase [Talaromyces proteolyticus]KAH8690795.1 putative 2-hydroxyhepta-2,4-diene-1,7-dioate isomerase [Talaromyces proteolyticus]